MLMKSLVIVTGASSGIGEACARHFSEAGHPLLLIARRLDRLKSLYLPNTICAQVDVTERSAMEEAIQGAEEQYGATGCLVNNAGVMLLGIVESQSPEEWKQMFDVNVLGLLNGMQLVLKDMKARNDGTIINISSVAGRKNYSEHAAYCGTKFAVHAITEGVRQEVSNSDVRLITISPGAVETELIDHITNEQIKQDYKDWKQSIGGVINADDVARSVVFAYQQPQNVCIREIVIADTRQQS